MKLLLFRLASFMTALINKVTNYVQDVRGRNEVEKQRAVAIWATLATILIFFVWVISFSLSIVNRQTDEVRLRAEAEKMAKAQVTVVSTSTLEKGNGYSLIKQLSQKVTEGTETISEGFWTVGSWLHK